MSDNFEKLRAVEWLHVAKWAASGGNSQPWKIEFEELGEDIIFSLSIDEEYRRLRASPMDVGGRASVMALGALTFNLEAVASLDGFALERKAFHGGETLWESRVVLYFKKSLSVTKSYTLDDIAQRRTDRTNYTKESVSDSLKNRIDELSKLNPDKVVFADATAVKKEAVKGLKSLEVLRWSDKLCLDSLLEEIVFSNTKDKSIGIPVKQLGAPFFARLFLKLLSASSIVRALFRKVGAKSVSRQSLDVPVAHSDRVYFLQAAEDSLEEIFEQGYLFQEMWTEVNRQGYAFQPISIALLGLRSKRKVKQSVQEKKSFEKANDFFKSNLGLNSELPIMGFRIGRSKQLAERCSRREVIPECVITLLDADSTQESEDQGDHKIS